MKVLSLFDGISCGMIALERAGIPVERYVAFEIDEFAIKVSEANYPMIEHRGDVFDADFTEFKDFDLLIGGSPCTFWSIAKNGRETTPEGMGGKLFMEYVRALKESGCKWFLYENNNSIDDAIKDFISWKLGPLPIMVNSSLVSAQCRKRCYWTNIPNVEQPSDLGLLLESVIDEKANEFMHSYEVDDNIFSSAPVYEDDEPAFSESILQIFTDTPKGASAIRLGEIGKGSQGQRIYSTKGKSVCLSANGGGQGAKTGLYRIDLPNGKYLVRKLSPLEAERLQTLPDNYTDGISDTQRYKCIGNGWTVNVIAHILKNLSTQGVDEVDTW